MKRYIFLLLLGASFWASAQRLKYKELFPLLPGMSTEHAKYSLKEYLVEDLDHPNANFRLALLYEKNYRDTDPLTDYRYAVANAEQAKIRYIKAKQLVDEHEVNRNNEYYFPIFKTFDNKGKPDVAFITVSTKISRGYDSCTQFLEKIGPIYKDFTKSVNYYDQAVKIFAEINSKYLSPEDLYLLYDSKLDERCTALKKNYDSSLFYLNQYLNRITEYPLKNHKQKYTIHPLETYRLDGLVTRLNFLTNNIDLWGYGPWVDNVRKIVTTEVADLRKKIIATNSKLDESLVSISKSATGQLPQPVKLDKQLIFNLNNLDRQSAILALLEYKDYKQSWDLLFHSQTLDSMASDRNSEIFSNLIYANRKADTLIKVLQEHITPLDVDKHKEFISRAFGSQAALEVYVQSEQQNINSSFNQYQDQLRGNILRTDMNRYIFASKENFIKSGKWNIPLTVKKDSLEKIDQGILMTQFNKKNPDGSVYISGLYRPDKKKNNIVTYVVHLTPDGKVAWLKDISVSIDSLAVGDAHTYVGPVVTTSEGCALLVRSVHMTRGDVANTFIYLNEKGEEKIRKKIKETAYPRFLIYSEKFNSFVLTLKGQEQKQNYSSSEDITLLNINALGDMTWKKNIQLTGNVVDLISLTDSYVLTGNFLVMNDQTGKEIRTKFTTSECSPYLIKISERGEVLATKPFTTPYSVYLSRVAKINDNSINLLGYKETIESGSQRHFNTFDKVVHIMTNRLGEIICSNY